jgi:hypothetical protein
MVGDTFVHQSFEPMFAEGMVEVFHVIAPELIYRYADDEFGDLMRFHVRDGQDSDKRCQYSSHYIIML